MSTLLFTLMLLNAGYCGWKIGEDRKGEAALSFIAAISCALAWARINIGAA